MARTASPPGRWTGQWDSGILLRMTSGRNSAQPSKPPAPAAAPPKPSAPTRRVTEADHDLIDRQMDEAFKKNLARDLSLRPPQK